MIFRADDIERLKQIEAYILSNLDQDLRLEQLCLRFSLSPARLKRQFAQYFRQPVYRYILQHRMDRAKQFLAQCPGSIAEVASLVGYADHSSFTHAFTRYFGQAPIDLLRQQDLPGHTGSSPI
ncbi:AraC family transcriptional regulator [Rurimicrobium arvi]|uniref:HTH araC/xylS-type domain-containing protein n=1 Tax=Rurimicrobium arvi TaxID=2049916 RepID=A0ABP8MRS1_9BACT